MICQKVKIIFYKMLTSSALYCIVHYISNVFNKHQTRLNGIAFIKLMQNHLL